MERSMAERRAKEADESLPEKADDRRASEPLSRNGVRSSGSGGGNRNGKEEGAEKGAVGPAGAGPWRSYKEVVAKLAERIVEGQRPIRVLQALRWDASVEERFLKGRQREMPKIDAAYYERVELGFDPDERA